MPNTPFDPKQLERRPIEKKDWPFLRKLYASTRWEELEPVGWSDDQKHTFLDSQFDAQWDHYEKHYKGASFDLLLYQGEKAGRFYLHQGKSDLRIVDIALIPAFRGGGLGRYLFEETQAKGRACGTMVSIHVERNNRALGLYERLGFTVADEVGPYFLMKWFPGAVGAKS